MAGSHMLIRLKMHASLILTISILYLSVSCSDDNNEDFIAERFILNEFSLSSESTVAQDASSLASNTSIECGLYSGEGSVVLTPLESPIPEAKRTYACNDDNTGVVITFEYSGTESISFNDYIMETQIEEGKKIEGLKVCCPYLQITGDDCEFTEEWPCDDFDDWSYFTDKNWTSDIEFSIDNIYETCRNTGNASLTQVFLLGIDESNPESSTNHLGSEANAEDPPGAVFRASIPCDTAHSTQCQ